MMGVAVASCFRIGQTGMPCSFSPTIRGEGKACTMDSRVITPARTGAQTCIAPSNSARAKSKPDVTRPGTGGEARTG